MSAWKNPSRNAWRRNVWITARASSRRSKPLACSRARSDSGVASIHSSVRTSLLVRSQSTVGHAKIRIILGVLGHFRERRRFQAKIHLDCHRTPQGIDHFDQPKPTRLGGKIFGMLGDKHRKRANRRKSAARYRDEAPSPRPAATGPSTAATSALDAPGRWMQRRPARPKTLKNIALSGRPNEASIAASASFCGKGGIRSCNCSRSRDERGADDVGPRREKLSKLDVARAEPRQRRGKARVGVAARRPFESRARMRTNGRAAGGMSRRIDHAEDAFAGENEAGATETQKFAGAAITNASRNAARQCRR